MEIKSKILNFMEILMISKIKTVLNFKITIIKINLIMIVVHGFNDSYNKYNIFNIFIYFELKQYFIITKYTITLYIHNLFLILDY